MVLGEPPAQAVAGPFFACAIGARSQARGSFAVAVGDDTCAVGDFAVSFDPTITLDESLTAECCCEAIRALTDLRELHSVVANHRAVQAANHAIAALAPHAAQLLHRRVRALGPHPDVGVAAQLLSCFCILSSTGCVVVNADIMALCDVLRTRPSGTAMQPAEPPTRRDGGDSL